MTTTAEYDDNVERAIAANDVAALIRYVYGYPCQCTRRKGEPLCMCRMQEKAARDKIVPLSLFKGRIERVAS